MMTDLPSSDQAFLKDLALIPIVGNNTERGGESVLYKSSSYLHFDLFFHISTIK